MTGSSEKVDLTRLSRSSRRDMWKRMRTQGFDGRMFGGRNLPYEKRKHGTLKEFNDQRAKEIEADKQK